jgi:hypothetical protein
MIAILQIIQVVMLVTIANDHVVLLLPVFTPTVLHGVGLLGQVEGVQKNRGLVCLLHKSTVIFGMALAVGVLVPNLTVSLELFVGIDSFGHLVELLQKV